MNAPPLLAHLTDLLEAVNGIATDAGCDRSERLAAHALLGTIVGSGEPSITAAIAQVRDVILFDRDRLLEIAVEAEREAAAHAKGLACRANRTRPQPSGKAAKKAQGSNPLQGRWDLEGNPGGAAS